ncbi:cation:proton antiporter regulatory subunit [Nocardia sp. alder85J]|uniref:cation:proton antiporter regulatory subunit n=1 Tax=Nocardia sp. alder85J TaxID=2862949 RepID=UPI001CD1B6D3|nr:TrkA C-terminal domain-containing protein [Nocardia sp. alder85J]MCX4094180.1 potassium transporter TrkA [Nocardia sp. alder85J]
MDVEVTPLPGIGVRKDFPLAASGRRVGVVDRKDGGVDLILSRPGNPDACEQVALTVTEAAALAGLLGAPRLVEQLVAEQRELADVNTRQLSIRTGSPYAGRPLGDTRMRTRTTASIVAVVRGGQTIPSPGPDFPMAAGDQLIVVGTGAGLDAAAAILVDG